MIGSVRIRNLVSGGTLLLSLLAPAAARAAAAAPAEPSPTVQGPITGGSHGRAFNDWPWPLKDYGYRQDEYFISGTAKAYGATAPPAAYKVRIQVLRPIDPRQASGTAVVEWNNVSAQYDIPLGWVWTHPRVMSDGDVYVMVSAQEVGVCGNAAALSLVRGAVSVPDPLAGSGVEVCTPTSLKGWDPQRYDSLHHPGDDYSFDIYSQAVQAIRHPHGIDPVAGITITHVIGYGQSQSASRFDGYLCNGADQAAHLIDAAIMDADVGTAITCVPRVPSIKLWSEESARPVPSTASANLRIWMIPGAPHEDAWQSKYEEAWTTYNLAGVAPSLPGNREMQADAGDYGQEGITPGGETCLPHGDEYPRRYIDDAAFQALKDWMLHGHPAPTFPSDAFTPAAGAVDAPFGSTTNFQHDAHLNTLGGIRSPVLDVPVATYIGPTCALFGETIPFTSVQLAQLYPTHGSYVDRMVASIQSAVAAGSMLPVDATDLMQRACASSIGGPPAASCPHITATSPYAVDHPAATAEPATRPQRSPALAVRPGTRGLAATGLPDGAAFAALGLLGAAWCVRRSRQT